MKIQYLILCRYVDDESRVGEIATSLGFSHVSLSHKVMAMVKIVPRGFTACADAYLTPHIKKYLQVNFLIEKEKENFFTIVIGINLLFFVKIITDFLPSLSPRTSKNG